MSTPCFPYRVFPHRQVITPHPRFLAFVANLRARKGVKTAALLPLAADASGARHGPKDVPSPWDLEDLSGEEMASGGSSGSSPLTYHDICFI